MSTAGQKPVNAALAKEFGLTADEYGNVLSIMGRTPSLTELGIFSVMWSEHCSYKSSRAFLKTLPTKAPWVIHGPGENAGVVDIGQGLAAILRWKATITRPSSNRIRGRRQVLVASCVTCSPWARDRSRT